MFPINQPSNGQGEKYNLPLEAIERLKGDPAFMKNYREGVLLVAQSWGWDLETGNPIQNDLLRWRGYNIRLQKMKTSLDLFDEQRLLKNLEAFENSVK